MTTLADILKMEIGKNFIVLVGKPEVTNFTTSDGEPYYSCQLKDEVTVRCSVDPNIEPFPTKEIFLRESAINKEGWKFVDEKKPEEGFYMPDWIVDFSKGQELPVYQETTIKKWYQTNRSATRDSERKRINDSIREKIQGKK